MFVSVSRDVSSQSAGLGSEHIMTFFFFFYYGNISAIFFLYPQCDPAVAYLWSFFKTVEPLQNAEHCNKTAERRQHWPAVPAKMTVCASKAVKVLWAKKKEKNVCIATISFSS